MRHVVTLLCVGVLCATAWAQRVERITYKGWQDAYRLSNGTVELVVVPSVARIMHYGFVGEQNTLWVNPDTAGKPVRRGEWINFGGDKAWIWPYDEWPLRIGRDWPPPPATEQVPHQLEVLDGHRLRLTSPLVAGYGVRIVREIRMEASGTRVHIQTRLEKMRDGAEFAVAAWVVAQIPEPDLLLARLRPDTTLSEGYKLFFPDPWKAVRRMGADILIPERRSDVAVKLGCDADVLAWFKAPYLLVHRTPVANLEGYVSGDLAQIYSNPAPQPYIELEFTSPRKVLRRGENIALEVTWELHRLPPEQATPDALATFLRR